MDVLVIGGNHQNTLGVIEALGQKGLSPYVIILSSRDDSYVLMSKYINEGWICHSDEDAIACIGNNFKNNKEKTLAITCSDDAASLLDLNYDDLKKYLVLPGMGKQGELTRWTDKTKMSLAAESMGLTIPKSWKISNRIIPPDIVFPCVTKPITSVKHGKNGFKKCDTIDDLQQYLNRSEINEPFQVQQFIDKDYEFQLLGCSLDRGKEIIIPGRTHIKTTTQFNNLVFLKFDKPEKEFDKIIDATKKYVIETSYSGLFSVEFMHGKDGKNYFLEMNFRNDGNGIAVTASGTNLPYIWYLFNSNGDYHNEIKSSIVKTTYMMPEFSFYESMLNGEVSYKEWKDDFKKTNCYLTYFKDDKRPFIILLIKQKRQLCLGTIKFVLKKTRLLTLVQKLTMIR